MEKVKGVKSSVNIKDQGTVNYKEAEKVLKKVVSKVKKTKAKPKAKKTKSKKS